MGHCKDNLPSCPLLLPLMIEIDYHLRSWKVVKNQVGLFESIE
jgi:hypothetical protein